MPVACPLRSHRNRPRGRHAPVRPHNRIGNATGGADTRIFDNQNRPTEMNSSPVTRDALGNITEDHLGNEFGYDAWNRLTTHDATDRYGYDALNRRNRFATRDLHYDADGNIIEEREDGIVTLQHHYSKSGQGIVARRNFASGSYSCTYYAMTLTDGSVMTIISSTGVQLEHYVYNPNGLVEMYAEGEFGDWTHDPEMPDREGDYGWNVGWTGEWWDGSVELTLGTTSGTYSPVLSAHVSTTSWFPPPIWRPRDVNGDADPDSPIMVGRCNTRRVGDLLQDIRNVLTSINREKETIKESEAALRMSAVELGAAFALYWLSQRMLRSVPDAVVVQNQNGNPFILPNGEPLLAFFNYVHAEVYFTAKEMEEQALEMLAELVQRIHSLNVEIEQAKRNIPLHRQRLAGLMTSLAMEVALCQAT